MTTNIRTGDESHATFWHTTNCAFSAQERAAFNAWRGNLQLIMDTLMDICVRTMDTHPRLERAGRIVESLNECVTQIPILVE